MALAESPSSKARTGRRTSNETPNGSLDARFDARAKTPRRRIAAVGDVLKEEPCLEIERACHRVAKAKAERHGRSARAGAFHPHADERPKPELFARLKPEMEREAHQRSRGIVEKNRHVDAGVEPGGASEMKRQRHGEHEAGPAAERRLGAALERELHESATNESAPQVKLRIGHGIVAGSVGLGVEGSSVCVCAGCSRL